MIKLVLLVFMSSLFAQDHFTSVDTTGLPYNIVITNISVDGHDPDGSAEVGIFDGDLCVGTAVFDGEFPFSVTAWKEYVNGGLPGFAYGNPISFKIWTEVFGEYHEIESTAVFSDGNGTFGSGAYSTVNLTVASGLYLKIVLSVEEINLGPVLVGETASQTIQVSNGGNADLTLFSIYSNNEQFFTDFSTPEEIEVGSSLDVMISYTPNQLLPTSGMIYFESDDPSNSTLAINLYGVVISPRILINPASIDFGIVDMGNNTQVDLYIENIGNEMLEVSSINSDNNVFNAPTASFDIIPGGLAVVTVQYTPDVSGQVYGTLSLISNDPFTPIETIDLSGYGYESHFQPVSATGLQYSIIVNDVLVDNHNLTMGDEIAVFDGELCVGVGVWDENDLINITAWQVDENYGLLGFTPGDTINFKLWATTFDTTLQVDAETEYIVGDGSFGFGVNSVVSLSALTYLEPVIRLSDEIIDFGIQPIFGTYTSNFSIFNDGILTLEVEDINSTNSAFSVNLNSFSISSGESQEIVLSFIPQQLNLYSGNLIVQSNDIYNSEIMTLLMGQGFPAEAPNLELLTSELNLGSVIINSSVTGEILIQNTGNTLLLIDNITSDNEQFEPAFNTLDIDVDEIGAIPITFSPNVTGYQTANISYSSNANEYFEINVAGYGSDGYFDVVSETGEATYFIIDSIYSQISDPIIGGEIGIFDGTTCVGVAIWDGNPLYIPAWLGDESLGTEGYTPGNPVSFYLYSNDDGENNVYNIEASFQSGDDGYFLAAGSTIYIDYLDVVELSTDFGCTETEACNYASDAFIDDRGCWYSVDGCTCEKGEGAELDDCGVCNGGNVDQDECGVCGGDGSDDLGCGCFAAGPSGCDNVCGSTLENDACGVCGGDGSDDLGCGCFAAGPSGCDNVCGSNLENDECGVCGGDGIADGACDCAGNVDDCAGICGGSTEVDECGICGGPGATGECDCDGIAEGTCDCDGNVLDECGVCGGEGVAEGFCDCAGNVDLGCGCEEAGPSGCDEACGSTLVEDECGVCGGDGSFDNCGICDANISNDCVQDCNDEWGGPGEWDLFDVCCTATAEFSCIITGCDLPDSTVYLTETSMAFNSSRAIKQIKINMEGSGIYGSPLLGAAGDAGFNWIVDPDSNWVLGKNQSAGITIPAGSCGILFNITYENSPVSFSSEIKDADDNIIGFSSYFDSGCFEEAACNYNPYSIDDISGSCNYPEEEYLDCNGECLNDFDEDGVCDELSLYDGLIPTTYTVNEIYPNPFNPIANIIYGIPENAHIRILVFDIRGRQVAKLMDSFQFAGYHAITWDATSQPSGVYLVKILSGRFNSTQKVVLMK